MIQSIAFSPDGKYLTIGRDSGEVTVWKVGEYAGQKAGPGKYHIRVNVWVNPTTNIQAMNKVPFHIVAFLHR